MTKDCAIPHKKDNIVEKIILRQLSISLYLTKCYKIIKIDFKNKKETLLMDFSEFYELIASVLLENLSIKSVLRLQTYKVYSNGRLITISKKNRNLLTLTKANGRFILKKMNRFYFSYLLSFKNLSHLRKDDFQEISETINNDIKCKIDLELNKKLEKIKKFNIFDKLSVAKLILYVFFRK